MSDLYTKPETYTTKINEGRDELTAWDGVLAPWFERQVKSGLSMKDGEVDRQGLAWWAQHLYDTDAAKKIAENKKNRLDAEVVETTVRDSGLTTEELTEASGGKKLTKGNVGGVVSRGKKTRAQEITPAQEATLNETRDARQAADKHRQTSLTEQREARKEGDRFRRHQLEVEGIRAENARRERQFEASQNRELTREQNMMQLQLANMERSDRREDRRLEREDRAADKRQQSIMMLIKGLTQLGAGFSI